MIGLDQITALRARTFGWVLLTAASLGLAGCAPMPRASVNSAKSVVISTLPADLKGETYSIFYIDPARAGSLDAEAIRAHMTAALAKRGMTLVDARETVPHYFLLFDYGTDIGIAEQYEHGLLVFMVDVSNGQSRQVLKASLTIDAEHRDVVSVASDAFDLVLAEARHSSGAGR